MRTRMAPTMMAYLVEPLRRLAPAKESAGIKSTDQPARCARGMQSAGEPRCGAERKSDGRLAAFGVERGRDSGGERASEDADDGSIFG